MLIIMMIFTGKCNLNGTDDFKMKNGTITDDTKAFGESWLVNDMPEGKVLLRLRA